MSDNVLPNNESVEVDEENIVTMVDVLKAEEIMEENADAVLGPGDDTNCTFSEGYLKRQALYSCLTCLPADGKERAGICLACSYQCHGDHDLVELYTKRNFRCDCGTSVFKDQRCKLDPLKFGVNEKNTYNHNFEGLYCTCKRPYPDPEDKDEDSMIQCFVCEDWFHTKHLDSVVPKEDDYAEMICGSCTDKLPFLQYYLGYSVSKITTSDNKKDVEVIDSNKEEHLTCPQTKNDEVVLPGNSLTEKQSDTSVTEDKENVPIDLVGVQEEVKSEKSGDLPANSEEDSKTKSPAKEVDSSNGNEEKKDCLLSTLKMLPREKGATFWPENLRKIFCTCSSCLEVYKNLNVPFITDEEDTVGSYEEKGKTRKVQAGPTQYERGMEALNSLDRVQQMEAILSYNEMKTHLSEYLAKFVENKKVVREEDIKEFFSGMQARKRQKIDIPYTCR